MTKKEVAADNSARVARIREVGIKHVKVIGSGNDDECAACREFIEKVYVVAEAPKIPPAKCRCRPYCMVMIVAFDPEDRSFSAPLKFHAS